jgi:hypothetical protein
VHVFPLPKLLCSLIPDTDGYELAIITIATFTQALAGSAAGLDIIAVLAFWRFMMGVGVGGDYPLSAVISAEFASAHLRGRLMTAVFAFQGLGNLRELLDDPSSSTLELTLWSCSGVHCRHRRRLRISPS